MNFEVESFKIMNFENVIFKTMNFEVRILCSRVKQFKFLWFQGYVFTNQRSELVFFNLLTSNYLLSLQKPFFNIAQSANLTINARFSALTLLSIISASEKAEKMYHSHDMII